LDFIKSARTPYFVDANSNGMVDAGEQIHYDFTLINTGNVDAVITAVTDQLPGFQFSNLSLPATLPALPAGQKLSFTGTHLVTQSEIDAGEILNSAEASFTAAGQDLKVQSRAPTGAGATRINIPEPPANSILSIAKSIQST